MKLFKPPNERGQSLVEMAIAAPILIIFLLGIFEVGAAVRNYLTLVNVNREITRFAVRPGYLDFSSEAAVATSYNSVKEWTLNSVSDQLDLDFTDTGDISNTGNTTMIISHFVVQTGIPCEDMDHCDCDDFIDDPSAVDPYTWDDLILHPGMGGQEYQAEQFGPPETVTGVRDTRLDYDAIIDDLAAQNNKFNCELIKKGGIPSANNVIITELFYDQPQLFGFPFISNPYTDPVPLYTHTSMRLIQGARDITSETTGVYCQAYPFIVRDITVDWPNDTYLNQVVDIFDGPGGSDFGWLTWDPGLTNGSQSEPFLEAELTYDYAPNPNNYTNARDFTDHELSVGDHVASMQGDKAAVEASEGLVSALVGQEITIPVWDIFDHGTGGLKDAYHIVGFAKVKIIEPDATYPTPINLPGKYVMAEYLGESDECY